MTEFVGYEFLRERWHLPVFPIVRPAQVMPVTRVTAQADKLLVPSGVAPSTNNPLDHVLFALKHEGTNLQVLSGIMPHITTEDIGRAVLIRRSATKRICRTCKTRSSPIR
ncbi:hypothetical protein SIL73_17670 [Acidithiobacillus thiooxidans]|uniref:hypothetical protein n=1 Tax=Acidithiobacillus thiooxidans TaxID=930 RepID=UPI0029C566B4|nr:hypothetical protein [Acidithiobacillus thiooxidans]MDX5936485.1 hypothetical protein [Acidithiobacillus thiooxidans]